MTSQLGAQRCPSSPPYNPSPAGSLPFSRALAPASLTGRRGFACDTQDRPTHGCVFKVKGTQHRTIVSSRQRSILAHMPPRQARGRHSQGHASCCVSIMGVCLSIPHCLGETGASLLPVVRGGAEEEPKGEPRGEQRAPSCRHHRATAEGTAHRPSRKKAKAPPNPQACHHSCASSLPQGGCSRGRLGPKWGPTKVPGLTAGAPQPGFPIR